MHKLRAEVGILQERQLQIDLQVFSTLQSRPSPDTILAVDDDEQILELLSQILNLHGYQVTALATSDEACALLKDLKPHPIMSDIDLKMSTMGGLSFYEKIRSLNTSVKCRSCFWLGSSDEILVRTGKQLGVDDYLTKLLSEQNLIATVKGN